MQHDEQLRCTERDWLPAERICSNDDVLPRIFLLSIFHLRHPNASVVAPAGHEIGRYRTPVHDSVLPSHADYTLWTWVHSHGIQVLAFYDRVDPLPVRTNAHVAIGICDWRAHGTSEIGQLENGERVWRRSQRLNTKC